MNQWKSVVALVVIGLAAGGGYYFGQRHDAPAAQTPERQVLYWYDPMMPTERFDKPGKSPFMDMDLVPRYADETPSGSVAISARQQQNLGMTVARAEKRALAPAFSAFATVTTDERSIQAVPAPANGVVETLFVRAPQQWVKAGEPLAQLWIPQWTAAQQEYLAVRQLGDAALTRAARARLALQFMPESIVQELERRHQPQTRLTLRAKRAGFVVKLDAREGAQVTATQPLFEIASLDPVWLVVDYSPGQAQALRVGSEVSATAAEGGEVFHGRVSELLPQLDPTTRTLKARIVLENPAQKLRPGMFLTVTQSAAAAQPAVLAVPEEALIDTGTQRRVLVASGDGYFKPVNVTTGITAGGWTQIVSGLQEGDNVVTSGQFLIDSEASLRSALPASHAQDATHNHTMPMEDAK
ncbi:efflux RND transporter periplasmic adaptor subunit [Enterobacter sp.]|uniref:efflux RND transporter periplasmic adaptor subunit n=1 Tax=Enterobacter sp. TaxID=42895 RepID=UPI00296F946D|nr:efflux RND transporter periplasmic adaptor subunit [Enterobacter sp.]